MTDDDNTNKNASLPSSSCLSSSYESILTSLLPPSIAHIPLSLPVSPATPHIPSDAISSLSVHPVLEAGLHILNLDLPSAHYLLRHMQSAPAWEAMYLHGILHRVEGDLENARAWYGDVKSTDVFKFVWDDEEEQGDDRREDSNSSPNEDAGYGGALRFLSQVETYKLKRCPASHTTTATGLEGDMTQKSQRELERFMTFCEVKFGTSPISDASSVWVSMAGKNKEQAANMVTGGEGWREF
ncbi:hypothetical protein PV08_04479 [Exophiala spinifera]|uniref:Uncharacterized protein n=1 Tax=Exophiala spinifera TaxID=91928 RepID=A0A0D2BE73_9EURO|nr:uncharacterized protein PV08_04479 [Exophiala spinifera]KIW17288.1 hypothetical protein PV08_04479 [Exophiala spinifera]